MIMLSIIDDQNPRLWCGFFNATVLTGKDKEGEYMETRIALIGIIVTNQDSVERINDILHQFSCGIIGRMGIPHRERGLNIISVALDAPENEISALAGKLGMLEGVTTKTIYGQKNLPKGTI